jgi:hypothetical protein
MSGKDKNDLDGWYLVRAYYKDAPPFAVLTDLRENAEDICKKVRTGIGAAKDYDYMKERAETETWLQQGAQAAGVDIRKEHPVYFVLTRNPEAYANWALKPMPGNSQRAERKIMIIPASEVDLSTSSFTYDDSFPSHQVSLGIPLRSGLKPGPLDGIIFNAQQIAEAVKIYGEPKPPVPGGFSYIEVQMWDKPSLTDFPDAVIHDGKLPAKRPPAAKVSP